MSVGDELGNGFVIVITGIEGVAEIDGVGDVEPIIPSHVGDGRGGFRVADAFNVII